MDKRGFTLAESVAHLKCHYEDSERREENEVISLDKVDQRPRVRQAGFTNPTYFLSYILSFYVLLSTFKIRHAEPLAKHLQNMA